MEIYDLFGLTQRVTPILAFSEQVHQTPWKFFSSNIVESDTRTEDLKEVLGQGEDLLQP